MCEDYRVQPARLLSQKLVRGLQASTAGPRSKRRRFEGVHRFALSRRLASKRQPRDSRRMHRKGRWHVSLGEASGRELAVALVDRQTEAQENYRYPPWPRK